MKPFIPRIMWCNEHRAQAAQFKAGEWNCTNNIGRPRTGCVVVKAWLVIDTSEEET